ncbi:MAG: endonuclease/exonuclease/phosphatase family protein [Candidatus Brocadiae bacterium]|nr:endonuclease/exonuclease/phosphatase family protein [Candidatus Brocadiia bacterium]
MPTRLSAHHWALLLALAAAGCARTREFEQPTGPHIRVLTYNVNWGMPQRAQTLAAIREARADVVCLQETTREWERILRQELSPSYAHTHFVHGGGAGGQAILSRWPVEVLRAVRPTGAFFHGWFVELQTPLGPVQVLGVHLRPPVDDQGRFGVSAYFATKDVRLKEVQALHAHLRPDTPTLILGDFNEKDNGPALKWLRKQGFTDALREFDRKTRTWQWHTSTITLRGRLDHILYSEQLHALEARVIPKGGSDHFPVLAILEKRRAPAHSPNTGVP